MHSIRTKMTALFIVVMLIGMAAVGAAAIYIAQGEAEERSEQLLTSICSAKRDEIDYYLGNIEETVETTTRFAYDTLDVVELWNGGVIGATGEGDSLAKRTRTDAQKKALDAYLTDYLGKTESLFDSVSSGNASVRTYYYRINEEFGGSQVGYWNLRDSVAGTEELTLTDISAYDRGDAEHVGWYFQPLDHGRPSWVDPYENENLEEMLISYVAPVYKAGTFVGVIGVDSSYSSLLDRIKGIKALDSGYAFLTDSQGRIVYHPQLDVGTALADVSPDLSPEHFAPDAPDVLSYTYEGAHKRAAWGTLANGLRLVVTVPSGEIEAGWRSIARFLMVAVVIVLLVSGAAVALFTRRITQPLERLAQAAEGLAQGKYDVDLSYEGSDEVGTLTKSFTQMAGHLHTFIQDLNSKAYRDALTGVRNKGAYDIYTMELDDSIAAPAPGSEPRFAVAMFDCNELKEINDTFGHEKGDIYLQKACMAICKVFAHSPVFRIGGDEFVAILQDADLDRRAELERLMEQRVQQANAEAQGEWERVSIAWGIAEYVPGEDENTEAVLNRADKAMYEAKRRHKEALRAHAG